MRFGILVLAAMFVGGLQAVPVSAGVVHRVLFRGWSPGGEAFEYAEVIGSGPGVPQASIHRFSLGKDRVTASRPMAAGEIEQLLLQPVGPEGADIVPAPDREAEFELQRTSWPADTGWEIRVRLAGGRDAWPVRSVQTAADAPRPTAFWAPDGRAVVFQFHWTHRESAGITSSLELVRYPRVLARVHNQAGLAAYERRDYFRASEHFEEASRLDPGFVDPVYNRACAFALRDERELALGLLGQALRLGGAGIRRLARRDPDFRAMRTWADFQELVIGPVRSGEAGP